MTQQSPKTCKSILVIHANAVSDFRMDLAARYLERAGYTTEIITEVPFYKASQHDLFLCCRPGDSMIEFLKICLLARRPVIVDLDDDFNAIPSHNPAYRYTGAGHPTYLRELKRLINHPGVLTTFASPLLTERYKTDGIIIPNCWDSDNEFWTLPKLPNRPISIGFFGTATHREDFKMVAPALRRIFDEFPDTRMIVNHDDWIYQQFGYLPNSRKRFFPGVPYAEYPLLFRHIDILIAPLRDTYFNRAKSDVKLMEAGATHTAWVASELPFYADWYEGGLLVKGNDNTDDWYEGLRELIINRPLREGLAEAGYQKALTRSEKVICPKWVELAGKVLGGEQ